MEKSLHPELDYLVIKFNVIPVKLVDAKDDTSIIQSSKKATKRAKKAEPVSFIPVLRKPSKKRIVASPNAIVINPPMPVKSDNPNGKKSSNTRVFYTNGNDSSYNGKITPIDAGMDSIATLAGNERDNCPSHKLKRVR